MNKIKIRLRSVIIGAAVGLLAGAALVMCAFASNDQDDPDSSRVVEEYVNGSYVVAMAATPDVVLGSDEEIIEIESGDADSEDIVRNVEAIEAQKDYLSDKTPEEIKNLSAEALAEDGKDTSLAEGELKTSGIEFDIPEGFEASEENPDMYVTGRFPIDASNVSYNESDADYTLQLMDESYFEKLVEDSFTGTYGVAADVKVTEYEQYKIDGVPAIRVKAEYDLDGQHISQLMVVINGSKTYTVVYTQNQDYDRMDVFEASAESISVK